MQIDTGEAGQWWRPQQPKEAWRLCEAYVEEEIIDNGVRDSMGDTCEQQQKAIRHASLVFPKKKLGLPKKINLE